MIIITSIYVIATIFICYFNYQSQKASRELTLETKRQFEESSRAFVTVNLEIVNNVSAALKIQNNGKRIANDVNIRISRRFIDNVQDKNIQDNMIKLSESYFALGIGQSLYLRLGNHAYLKDLSDELLTMDVTYSDYADNYKEVIRIDLSQYFWSALYTTPIEKNERRCKLY